MTSPSTQPDAPFAAPSPDGDPRVGEVRRRLAAAHSASAAPPEKGRAKLDSQHKLYVRDRIGLLFSLPFAALLLLLSVPPLVEDLLSRSHPG